MEVLGFFYCLLPIFGILNSLLITSEFQVGSGYIFTFDMMCEGASRSLRSAGVLKQPCLRPHLTSFVLTSPPHLSVLQPCCRLALPAPRHPGTSICQCLLFPRLSPHRLPHFCPAKSCSAASSDITSCTGWSFLLSMTNCPACGGAPKHWSVSLPQPGFPAMGSPSPKGTLVEGQALFLIRIPDTL